MLKLTTFNVEDLNEDSDLLKAINGEEDIFAKDLSFEDKILFFKEIFKRDNIINPSLLVNISLLILGGSLEDEIFSREDIFFKSLVEYLDIKYELKTEINEFNLNLSKFFLGILKGYSVKLRELQVEIPYMYRCILEIANFSQISKILNKCSINLQDCSPVVNSSYYLDNFCKKNEAARALSLLFLKKEEEN